MRSLVGRNWKQFENLESWHQPILRSGFNPQLSVKEPRPPNNYSSLNGRVKYPLTSKKREKHHSAKYGQNKGRMWEFAVLIVGDRRAYPSRDCNRHERHERRPRHTSAPDTILKQNKDYEAEFSCAV